MAHHWISWQALPYPRWHFYSQMGDIFHAPLSKHKKIHHHTQEQKNISGNVFIMLKTKRFLLVHPSFFDLANISFRELNVDIIKIYLFVFGNIYFNKNMLLVIWYLPILFVIINKSSILFLKSDSYSFLRFYLNELPLSVCLRLVLHKLQTH